TRSSNGFEMACRRASGSWGTPPAGSCEAADDASCRPATGPACSTSPPSAVGASNVRAPRGVQGLPGGPATMGRMPTQDQIREALRAVIDPELRRDIVELGMVRSIDVHQNGVVDVTVSLTTPGCPIRSHFQTGVANAVKALDGVVGVNVSFDVLSDA